MELPHIVAWQDQEPTGALGWLVIDSLVNGVCSGGLFMHEKATLVEVAELAQTMTIKNALQSPRIGGAKGGIRFDHRLPAAEGVLQRFLLAHRTYIENIWSTGADLNTDNATIHKIICENLKLASGFVSVGGLLSRMYGIESQAGVFYSRIQQPVSNYFTLGECATGHSIAFCIHKFCSPSSRVLIQGWGNVGRSVGYFLQTKGYAQVVGIIEKNYFIYAREGLNINRLLAIKQTLGDDLQRNLEAYLEEVAKEGYEIIRRSETQEEQAFLSTCLLKPADIFCPCATRYVITDRVSQVLKDHTFNNKNGCKPWVISGANNVFANKNLVFLLEKSGIAVLPEWLSNSGNTLAYNEILKLPYQIQSEEILATISGCLDRFIKKVSRECERRGTLLYETCYNAILKEIEIPVAQAV